MGGASPFLEHLTKLQRTERSLFLSMFSQKVTADILKGLEKGSKTSLKLGVAFPEWLSHWTEKSKTRVEIVYFFEELTSSFGGKFVVVVRQFPLSELDRMLSQARVLADKVARARTVVDDLQTGVLTHIGSSTQRWSSCLLQSRDAMGYLPEEAV